MIVSECKLIIYDAPNFGSAFKNKIQINTIFITKSLTIVCKHQTEIAMKFHNSGATIEQ